MLSVKQTLASNVKFIHLSRRNQKFHDINVILVIVFLL